MILDDECMTAGAPDKVLAPRHPLPGFEEVVMHDLDVGRSDIGRSSTEHDGFTGGFQEVVRDFVWAILVSPLAAPDGMRVGASPSALRAMKVAEIGIDHSDIVGPIQRDAVLGIVMSSSVQPGTVDDDVIGDSQWFNRNKNWRIS